MATSMLFTADAWPGIAAGTTTVTFRRWTRPQARVGARYRVGGMLIEATAVAEVDADAITDGDAVAAGERDRDALLRRLGGANRVWRIDFRYVGDDDRIALREETRLDGAAVEELRRRLDRLDRGGAWTRSTLRLIERYPGVVSTALARQAGMDRVAFKTNVRKLKQLGLTESLDTGYRLSPRGVALLAAFDA